MENKIKVGDIIKMPNRKRDINFNRIGGLKVEVLEIFGRNKSLARVKLISTGNETTIII